MKKSNDNTRRLRSLVAEEAARLLANSGHRDYKAAKRRAADRLGAKQARALPSNEEVEQALAEYQRTFLAGAHDAFIDDLRSHAIDLMERLSAFAPYLTGPVLTGTANSTSDISPSNPMRSAFG